MIVLALDTTTFTGSAAVLKKTKLLAEVNIDSPSTYSERLLPNIDFILKFNGLKMKDIDAFSIAVGPGSFTGIRIGLSTIKSFAYASIYLLNPEERQSIVPFPCNPLPR